MLAGALCLLFWIYQREGITGISEAFGNEIKESTIKLLSICTVFVLIAGSIDHLAKKNPAQVQSLISGQKGIIPMLLISMVLPGPAGANQLHNEWMRGKNHANIILCLTAMMGMGINIFIFRALFLGPQLTFIWIVASSFLMFQVWLFCKIFIS